MIEIRRMQLADCEQVARIAEETLPERWSYQDICSILQYDYDIYYVGWDTEREEVIGFAGIMVIAEDAELLNIAVTPRLQHEGVGKRLLEQVIQAAWERGAERMLLEVRQGNIHAQQLYGQYHFEIIGKRKNYYSNPTEDALIMNLNRQRESV